MDDRNINLYSVQMVSWRRLEMPRSPRRTFHHGSLPSDVLVHARAQLERDGAAALSLRGVAKATGVFPTAISHHFGDREGLLAALAAEGFADLRAAFVGALARGQAPRAALRALLAAYVAFAHAQPATFQLMFSPWSMFARRHAELEQRGHAAFDMLADAVAAWSKRRGTELDALATSIWCTVHGLAILSIEERSGTREGRFDVEAILDLALR